MDMAEEAAIKVKGLYKLYRVGEETVRALNGVDFEIKKGEFCSIVGASGSGKSTLLNMLAGLEKPTKGEIIIAGEHIEKKRENQLVRFRREHIGFIFQSFNLMSTMNAIENVALPLNFQGMNRTLRRKKAEKALKLVGLQKYMKHRPTQMSGGQQQRVGVARALVMQPEIIFADEPTVNLDSKTSREVMELMQKIVRKRHQTLVMVTHDNYLAGFADRIIHIMDGKIVKVEENHNPQGILANGGEAQKEDAPKEDAPVQNGSAQTAHKQNESTENAQTPNVSGQAAAENGSGQTGQTDSGVNGRTG
ncbi:MAG: ABC transporter ATP-binding protein [Lachnospiraceae bacterium]|nr:ABC transporter ATP-binding protein [Lachnospiraceae bacterium]